MKTYKVVADEVSQVETTIEAKTPEEALEKAKAGGEDIEWAEWSDAEFMSDLRFNRAIVIGPGDWAELDLDQRVRDDDGSEHKGHETYRRMADGTLERVTHRKEEQDEQGGRSRAAEGARLRLVNQGSES